MSDRERPPAFAVAPASTRRTILRTAGLAALAGGGVGVLGACSSDAGVTAPPAASSAPAASAPPSPAATSASASASESASASASESASPSATRPARTPSGPSVAASKVPVGGGVILEGAELVVTQPRKGEFKAFSSICTHQGCAVTKITGDSVVCPCHGSAFSLADGSVLQAPATRPLAESATTVVDGTVYVDA